MIKEIIEKIIDYATAPEFSDEVFKAREEYNNSVGEIYEDDQSYDDRMSQFLEWYVFDRNFTGKKISPLLGFIEKKRIDCPEESLQEVMNLTKNIHGLFQVKKISREYLVVYDFFTNKKYKVMEKQCQLVFRKNELFEGRIIPCSNSRLFTGVYCFHPKKSKKFIKKKVKKLIKLLKTQESQLKIFTKAKLSKETALLKTNEKLKILEEKIKNTKSDARRKRHKDKWEELDTLKLKLEGTITDIASSILEIQIVKNPNYGKEVRNLLMHRLAYMSLKWERFRKIDIENIYTD